MRKLTFLLGLGVLCLSANSMAAEGQGRGQQALENLDSNGDGVVDFNEFQENTPDIVARLDTDGDSSVSLEEFVSARPDRPRRGGFGNRAANLSEEEMAERQAMMQERMTERFSEMDLDDDGLVSVIEMQEANFLQMDNDGDGVLSASELRRRGPGGPGGRGPGQRGRPDRGSEPQSADS